MNLFLNANVKNLKGSADLLSRRKRPAKRPEHCRRKKNGNPWPENFSCDATKEDRVLDEAILNPLQIPEFPRLFKFLIGDGEMQVDEGACREAGISIERAANTIAELNLNCQRLKDSRAAIIREIEKVKSRARINRRGNVRGQTYEYLISRHLSKRDDGSLPRFFTTRRWALGKSAEVFLQDNRANL